TSLIPRHPRSTLFPYTTLFRSDFVSTQTIPTTSSFADSNVIPFTPEAVLPIGRTSVSLKRIALPDFFANTTSHVPLVNFPSNNRSEEHTSELQSRENLVCRLLL